jgi:hypothetical protein
MATSLLKGSIDQIETSTPGMKKTTMGSWCRQRIDYINGGITINYPAGLFTVAPIINVTTELQSLAYSSDLQITPIITSNTISSSNIRINIETGGGVTEAATNDVYVNIFSISK